MNSLKSECPHLLKGGMLLVPTKLESAQSSQPEPTSFAGPLPWLDKGPGNEIALFFSFH